MYELVTQLARPSVILLIATIVSAIPLVFFAKPCSRRQRVLFRCSFGLLLVLCMPVVATLCLGSLEWRYPLVTSRPNECQAIVCLGGYLKPVDPAFERQELGGDSIIRCLLAAELYRSGPAVPVLVCGGIVEYPSETTIADAMSELLVGLGVDREDIWIENRSTSTHENALFGAELLRSQGVQTVALVTDALHMTRARRCFEVQGIEVIPRGARHRAGSVVFKPDAFIPALTRIGAVDETLHEYLGIVWYWMRGYFDQQEAADEPSFVLANRR